MSSASLKTYLGQFQAEFETNLDRQLPERSDLSKALRYAALGGGKRLRPFLMIEAAKLFNGAANSVWACAAALECVHVYSLIHDDLPCMDDDDLRRGKPTVHKAFDEASAVLSGDALLTRAFEILGNLEAPAEKVVALVKALALASGESGMIGGQVLDITAEKSPQDEGSITRLQKLKTGALIRFAVWSGAFLAGANSEDQDKLVAYGDDLGLLFQITDDILDEIGDAEKVGKAVNKDKNLGKATFVSILGLVGAKERATILADRAKRHLEPFGEKAQNLIETVDYVLNREH